MGLGLKRDQSQFSASPAPADRPYSPPCTDASQPLAVTPKFISPFNWISRKRVRHRVGMSRAAGVPGTHQGGSRRGGLGRGCCGRVLPCAPTNLPAHTPRAPLAGRAEMPYFWCQISANTSRFHFIALKNGWA